jgi:hypothetical protein
MAPCSPNPTVFSYFAAIPNQLRAERKLDQRHVIKRATPSNSSIFLDSYFYMIYMVLNILDRRSCKYGEEMAVTVAQRPG